jgi:hypothetical protein
VWWVCLGQAGPGLWLAVLVRVALSDAIGFLWLERVCVSNSGVLFDPTLEAVCSVLRLVGLAMYSPSSSEDSSQAPSSTRPIRPRRLDRCIHMHFLNFIQEGALSHTCQLHDSLLLLGIYFLFSIKVSPSVTGACTLAVVKQCIWVKSPYQTTIGPKPFPHGRPFPLSQRNYTLIEHQDQSFLIFQPLQGKTTLYQDKPKNTRHRAKSKPNPGVTSSLWVEASPRTTIQRETAAVAFKEHSLEGRAPGPGLDTLKSLKQLSTITYYDTTLTWLGGYLPPSQSPTPVIDTTNRNTPKEQSNSGCIVSTRPTTINDSNKHYQLY